MNDTQDADLAEDHRLLAFWHEELSARREERTTLQARHRERLEDALDHLESLRKNARDRQADMAAAGQPSPSDSDVGLNVSSISDSDVGLSVSSISDSDVGLSVSSISNRPTPPPPDPFTPADLADYRLPSLDLLRAPTSAEQQLVPPEEVAANKLTLQNTLDSFAVDAFVHDSIVGPRVTQFRVKPGFGVRVESIAALEKNLALALSANAVRIQAPIPGESFVGVETPNRHSVPLARVAPGPPAPTSIASRRAWCEAVPPCAPKSATKLGLTHSAPTQRSGRPSGPSLPTEAQLERALE